MSTAYAAIRAMPSQTRADYKAILKRHVLELKELSEGLENDMMGLASGDASCFHLANAVSELALVIGVVSRQLDRLTEAAGL